MTIQDYIKIVKKWEGKLSKDKVDSASSTVCPTPYKGVSGYHTNCGITYAVWKSYFGSNNDVRFYAMSDEDWFTIFDKLYFSAVRGKDFKSINVASIVTGIAWGSGAKRAGLTLQQAINNLGGKVDVDGKIGPATIKAANAIQPVVLFDELMRLRIKFFHDISKGKNAKFLRGWLARADDYIKLFRPINMN